MKMKDQIILRKIADQYVLVPVGQRTKDMRNVMYITSSAAYLWEYMKEDEFTVDSLVKLIMDHYINVSEEIVRRDILKYIQLLRENNLLEKDEDAEKKYGSILVWKKKNE